MNPVANHRRLTPRRAVTWLGLVVVFGATLELAARVDDWITYGAAVFGSYDMDGLFRPTPRGYRGVPHASYAKWGLDALGFRGPELRPAAGQIRVVAYGASETFGIYEDPGLEFPRVLERDLNSRTAPDRFEVVNAGMPGMRVGSGITYLSDIGQEVHPQVVVIYPTPTHYIGVTHPYCGRPLVVPVRAAISLPHLRMVDKLKDRLKEALPPAELTLMRQFGIALAARGERVIDRVETQSLAALETDLHCAVKAARDIGAIPILVTHANRFGPGPRADDDYWLTGWRLQYPQMRQSGLLDLETSANARIRAVASQERVKLVDAAAVLSGIPDNFADHAHFTNTGA
ncbi:MAG: hypothetical protein JWN43_1858, partial [Gammaproteobacteria bacterium]|nr:hypothetical protein [Gammaproteobacteria bacterium]